MRPDMEEYWSCAEAGEATATKQQEKVGRIARARFLKSVTESEYSMKSSSTMSANMTPKPPPKESACQKRKILIISAKDIEAALEGKLSEL